MGHRAYLYLLSAAIFVWAMVSRIWTYASGQDPATYIEIARGLQQKLRGAPPLSDHMSMVAPLYPTVLAIVRESLGPFAVYWVNPILCIAWIFLAGWMVIRFTQDCRQVSPTLLMTIAAAFLGYSLFPHFALYPFRSPLMLVLMFLGFLQVYQAQQQQSACRLVAGCSFFLLAGLTREFALIGWLFSGIWWMGGRNLSRRLYRTGLVLFFAPILLAFLSAPFWILRSASGQVRVFFTVILHDAWTKGLPFLWDNFCGITKAIGESLGIFGILCLLIGLWQTRGNRAIRWFILAPGIFFAFAYVPFLVHWRYIQEAVAFLAILAGIGLGQICIHLSNFLPRPYARFLPALAQIAFVGFAIVPPMLSLKPAWGRVTRGDIRRAVPIISQQTSAGDFVIFDHPEGHLWEVLQAHTLLRPTDVYRAILSARKSPVPIHYFESLDRAGWASSRSLQYRFTRTILEEFFDLNPWPSPFLLGGVVYHAWTCAPPSQTHAQTPIRLPRGLDQPVWVDFGNHPIKADIYLEDPASSTKTLIQHFEKQMGWTPMDLSSLAPSKGFIRLEASTPILRKLTVLMPKRTGETSFSLDFSRRTSSQDFFDVPSRTAPNQSCGVVVSGDTIFTLPPMPIRWKSVQFGFRLQFAPDISNAPKCKVVLGTRVIEEITLSPERNGKAWIGGEIPCHADKSTPIHIRLSTPDGSPPQPVWISQLLIKASNS